jgi:hypothetical protein
MKARLFRVGVTLTSVLMMLEVMGAGKKWGR